MLVDEGLLFLLGSSLREIAFGLRCAMRQTMQQSDQAENRDWYSKRVFTRYPGTHLAVLNVAGWP